MISCIRKKCVKLLTHICTFDKCVCCVLVCSDTIKELISTHLKRFFLLFVSIFCSLPKNRFVIASSALFPVRSAIFDTISSAKKSLLVWQRKLDSLSNMISFMNSPTISAVTVVFAADPCSLSNDST